MLFKAGISKLKTNLVIEDIAQNASLPDLFSLYITIYMYLSVCSIVMFYSNVLFVIVVNYLNIKTILIYTSKQYYEFTCTVLYLPLLTFYTIVIPRMC